jgi:hypothetical protein
VFAAIIIDEYVQARGETQGGIWAGAWHKPWTCMNLLGKSPLHRFKESLKQAGFESVSVVVNHSESPSIDIPVAPVVDLATARLAHYKREGFETVLISRLGPYVELSFDEMFEVHQQCGEGITRVATEQGLLDVWMLDCARFGNDQPILPALRAANPPTYQSQRYVNPLESAGDLRRLVVDSFNSRCCLRPEGNEIKPGVWICEGAQIERSARIVAPAFIGRAVQISEDCLVTRCSNIEHDSFVDFGTAVEDSSIMPNSYIGIGLDLSHSIVDGRYLSNLRHNVTLQITDPVVMRQNPGHEADRRSWAKAERSEMALTAE